MRQFNVGDRVEVLRNYGHYAVEGLRGTVKAIIGDNIGVEHDREFPDGHTIMGNAKDGYGLWYSQRIAGDYLKVIPSLKIAPNINLDSII